MAFNITVGDDTVMIFDRLLTDFATAQTSEIALPNDLVTSKTGKNGNTIFARNAAGQNATLTLRIMRGSSDDRFLSGKLNAQINDFTGVELASGEYSKRLGDTLGNRLREVYTLTAGMFTRIPGAADNQDGDTEQGVITYTLTFANVRMTVQ